MIGRRLPDLRFSEIHPDLRPGDYWKILDGDGQPRQPNPPQPSNLTGTCWYVVSPLDDPADCSPGRLEAHTVREHDDGTISVLPGDGSTNSVKITGREGEWHGFIYAGEWRPVAGG